MTQRTPLYEEHKKLGGKIVDFAGFEMPVQYSGVMDEHNTVRNSAGLFDVSHMGEFEFKGPGALEFLNKLTPNDVNRLTDNMAQYSMLCNEQGGIVDDILIYRLNAEHFVMVVNASNIEKDWKWVNAQRPTPNVQIKNISDETCLLAWQGPKALEILKQVSPLPISELKPFRFAVGEIAGQKDCWVARTGYTGEDGVEIFCKSDQVLKIWQSLLKAGTPLCAKPIGLGARDTLRLEARLSLYGHEITDATNPLEAGLSWVVKLDKPQDFIGKQKLMQIRQAGLARQIVGFKMIDKGIPRQGCPIAENKEVVGVVTSGTFSPTLGVGIGLGYVPTALTPIGSKFNVDIRGTLKLAEVVSVPFYKRK
ncbi:MAG: glycine cleavage system aminomethyltransferase GcvT [Deltaproteobacteria bacterium]|nr:glycine cleavage system aminomethyltransferase GcvT [Deltaproteobacteria bacterium]